MLIARLTVLEIEAPEPPPLPVRIPGRPFWLVRVFMPGRLELGVVMLPRIDEPLATLAKSPSVSSVLLRVWLIRAEGLALTVVG